MSETADMGEDKIWLVLVTESGAGEGQLISRMRLPNDALRSALTVDGAILASEFGVEGAQAIQYEVFTVER